MMKSQVPPPHVFFVWISVNTCITYTTLTRHNSQTDDAISSLDAQELQGKSENQQAIQPPRPHPPHPPPPPPPPPPPQYLSDQDVLWQSHSDITHVNYNTQNKTDLSVQGIIQEFAEMRVETV